MKNFKGEIKDILVSVCKGEHVPTGKHLVSVWLYRYSQVKVTLYFLFLMILEFESLYDVPSVDKTVA